MPNSNTPPNNSFDDLDAQFEAEFAAEQGADKNAKKDAKSDAKESKKAKQEGSALGKIYLLLEEINAAEARGEYKEALKLCRGGIQRILIPHRKFRGGALGLASQLDLSTTKAQLEQRAKDLIGKIKAENNSGESDKCDALIKEIKQAEKKGDYKEAIKLCRGSRLRFLAIYPLFRPSIHGGAIGFAKRKGLSQEAEIRQTLKDIETARSAAEEAQMLQDLSMGYSPAYDEELKKDKNIGPLIEQTNGDSNSTTNTTNDDDTTTNTPESEPTVDSCDYIDEHIDISQAEAVDNFYDNYYAYQNLLTLVKDYHHAQKRNRKSLIEQLNLDKDKLVHMYATISGSIRSAKVEESELVQWISNDSIDPIMLLADLFGVQEQDSPRKIDESIAKFNKIMDSLPAWKKFCAPTAEVIGRTDYNSIIGDASIALVDAHEKIENSDELKKERERILATVPSYPYFPDQGFDYKAVNRLEAGLVVSDKDALKGQIGILIRRGDIQDSRDALQEIEDAFECSLADYATHYADTFEGKTLNEVRRELNAAFPTINLGSLVLKLNNPDQSDDLMEAIANRLNITDINKLVEEVNTIASKLVAMYPKLNKSASIGSHFGA